MVAIIPLSGSDVRLLSGIPWSNDYKHTRLFEGQKHQQDYFAKAVHQHTMNEATFIRTEGGGHRVAVNAPIDKLRSVNYMTFNNNKTPPKTFYCFVTFLEYENRNTTWVHFEVDVLQTWLFDFALNPTFVVREHAQQYTSSGRPVVNTVPEGLEYGDAFDTVYTQNIRSEGRINWLVIVASNLLHGSNEGDIEPAYIGTPQPLSYYVVPFVDGGGTPNYKEGSDTFPISYPEDVLKDLYTNDKTVGSIVSIYISEYIGIEYNYETGHSNMPDTLEITQSTADLAPVKAGESYMLYVKNVEHFLASKRHVMDNKYRYFNDVADTKLLMYPYAFTVIDDFKGNRLTVKNEYIGTDSIDLYLKGSLGTSNKTSWGVKSYNNDPDATINDERMSNEMAIINNDPSAVPVVNDMLAAFMQGNRNSLEQQRSNAISSNLISGALTVGGAALAPFTGGLTGMAAVSGAMSSAQNLNNAAMEIGNIQSKKQDADNQPAQISQMGSNIAYDMGNSYRGVWIMQKQIKPEYRRALEDYFHMYGTKQEIVKKPNLYRNETFNYVETRQCHIVAHMNQQDADTIRRIFDSGVTFWHTNDVGNYDVRNEVVDNG